MLMLREGAIKNRGSLLDSTRVQALVSVVFAVFVPALLRYQDIYPGLSDAAFRNSMIGGAGGVLFGLFLLRRVTAFPGTRAFGIIVPSFGTSYGLVFTIFFSLRLDYGRIYLASSFGMALLTSYLISFWLARYGIRRFYVVPAGRTELIVETPDVEWVMMQVPEVPAEKNAAIVADLRHDHDDDWERMLAHAAVAGHPVYHTKQLRESLTGQVSIEHLSENSFGSLLPNLAYSKVKRGGDLLGCILMTPLLFVPMLLIALAIRFDSPGAIFFFQERMGYRGRTFMMLKFRTMYERSSFVDGRTEREDAMTQQDDDRITRVGRFLRRTRLDELPQMFNILRGEMSWIGPRPEAVALSHWYEAELPFYVYRHIVRPGITGWAQVNHGHVTSLEDVDQKLKYDFYYIKNFSAWIDILITLRTLPTMLSGFGSK